ncbi:hypothetical protein [Pedobacter insulae]|uniref:Uncharacterized protein n=1 Tax=Pedobacter insulae TaxID=414048 RepID=A0A1I2YL46_9SPHI|nr:hypothetical protein [Pedobacter insulae]SFH26333.1 hypothetical protein SAMN04489864_107179 [Pedobacter insulae]
MKRYTILCLLMLSVTVGRTYGQQKNDGLKMISKFGSDTQELFHLLRFEGVDYYKIDFTGKELKNKTYRLSVKEIWDGKIKSDTIVFNSKDMAKMGMDKVNDTTLALSVISKLTSKNKIKISFMFPRFSVTKEYDALANDDYSLRNLADESKLEIGYGKKFHFMAMILPFERADGSKSWCDIGSSGNDVENWGKKFGIKHYLLFEMQIE